MFGAGLVGVELAAEIAEVWPDKKVVLRTRGKEVLPGFPAKAQKKALAWFSKHGTQIIFDNAISPARYTPNKDELVFDCTGVKPVTMDAMFHRNNDATPTATVANGKTRSRTKAAASTPTGPSSAGRPLAWSSQVDARTQLLRITPEMHLVGHENIFAIGDVMVEDALRTLSPQARAAKVAYQAELQAWVVSENLKRQSESRPEWRFPIDVAAVDSSPTLIACSLGAYDGAVIFNDIVITGYFAAFSKDVLEATKVRRGSRVEQAMQEATRCVCLHPHPLTSLLRSGLSLLALFALCSPPPSSSAGSSAAGSSASSSGSSSTR